MSNAETISIRSHRPFLGLSALRELDSRFDYCKALQSLSERLTVFLERSVTPSRADRVDARAVCANPNRQGKGGA